MARSLGWHSRSKVTPYFLQASQTGPKRSTSSSRLTCADVGNGVPAEAGRQRREQEEDGSSNGPASRRSRARPPCGFAACRGRWPAARRPAGLARACSWISLPTSSGTKYGSVRGGLLPLSRQALYAARASPPMNCSVLALGSSPRAWPCRWVATVKISRPCFLARSTRSLAYASAPASVSHLSQVELPARFFPAVEAGVLEELDPFVHRHVAELAANQADLVIRSLAVAMRGGLLEAHASDSLLRLRNVLLRVWRLSADYTAFTPNASKNSSRRNVAWRTKGLAFRILISKAECKP